MAKRDQIVEQCTRIMGDPTRIRNMAIAAHVDHGKSVPAETELRLADGSSVEAATLFERFEEQGTELPEAFEGDAYELAEPPVLTSYDKDSGDFVEKEILYAAVHNTETLYEISAGDRDVRVTPEHPFLVMGDDATFEYRQAEVLSEGATIVAHGSVEGSDTATATVAAGGAAGALHRRRLDAEHVSFVTVDSVTEVATDEPVYDFGVKETRNFVAEGLVVHNTTLSDHLLAGAGMMPESVAGDSRQMDTEEDEQERGITIDAANVSMTHEYEDDEFLINLIDTPGHVDFGGDVTRAMRAVDGVLILVDAVDGVMPQTETVVRQAMREGVKPTLFINKVDRLIGELQEGPEQVQARMQEIIEEVNDLIRGLKPDHIDEDWQTSVADGTVAFGSALRGWALTAPMMRETGVKFGQINEWELDGRGDELADEIPAEEAVLDMVIEHFPSPAEAQGRRIDTIWQGDTDSDIGRQMRDVEKDGDTVFMVTDIGVDEHSGEIATGRVFSGTLESGDEVYINGVAGTSRINSVGIVMGDERGTVDGVPAGNIAAVTGLDKAIAGSTVSSIEMTPFEGVDHISEPVITKSIEPERMGDLDDLRGVLQQVSKEDPTIRVQYDEDTGESLISGQGELHLEVVTHRIEENQNIPIKTGDPIVIYRERPSERSDKVEIRTSNGLNDFVFSIEPLPQDAVEAIKEGDVSMNMPDLDRREVLQDAGVEKEATQEIEDIVGTTIFADVSKGVQRLDEVMDHIVSGVEEATESGPLAAEPVEGILVRLHDATIHEDPAHRGPAEIIPAVRQAVHGALLDGRTYLYEPMQNVRIDVPNEHMGSAMGEITSRRGEIGGTEQEAGQAVVNGSAPVEEMLGFSNDIRSVTDGRASWNTENSGFSQVPTNLQREIIQRIRERKGMKTELPDAANYL